jgi:hypothetical protein
MIEYPVNLQPVESWPDERVTSGRGRLRIDLPVSFFETAYLNFTEAAQAFAMSLSGSRDRRFAYKYL